VPDEYQIDGYEIGKEIGAGGMARVFLAKQMSLHRQVAIKILHPHLTGGGDFRKRFLHEGQMLARLNHPNIVAIYDIGTSNDASYMAMEYLQSGTLNQRIRDGMSLAEVIRVCTQIAHALSLAHHNHIVHRDLKPSNIMFKDEVTPVLTDFGIARQLDTDHRMTKTGMVVGTPYYMSPEQLSGQDIDGRADLYSLGVMLFELLTGDLPFKAEEPLALAMQHVQQPPPPLPDNLAELQPILDKMLAKSCTDRFGDMIDFCEAMQSLVAENTDFASRLSGETQLFSTDQFSDPRFKAKAPKPASSQETGMASSQITSGGGRWRTGKLLAIAAMLLISAGVGTYMLWPDNRPGLELSDEKQQIVDNLLMRVNGYIAVNQIDTPEGKNAVQILQQIEQMAPNHPDARDLAEQIIIYYQTDASLALDNDDLEAASINVNKGLALIPDNKALLDLKFRIESQQQQFENQLIVTRLLNQASGQIEQRQLVQPVGDNALSSFDQVLKIDPLNETASKGRQAIQQTLIDQIDREIAEGELQLAARHLSETDVLFPGSRQVLIAREALNNAQGDIIARQEVAELLDRADTLMTSGTLVSDDGESALDLYQSVLGKDMDNTTAIDGLSRIGSSYANQAEQALAGEQFPLAASLAQDGLRALPDNSRLLNIQSRAISALGQQEQEIENALASALSWQQQGNFFGPGDQNAYAGYQRALELDLDNARAKAALRRLPEQIIASIQSLQRADRFTDAMTLLEQAQAPFGAERFAALRSELDQQLAAQQTQRELQQQIQQTRQLIAVRPFTQDSILAAAGQLKQLLQTYPNDARLVALLAEYTQAIAGQAESLSQGENDLAALILMDYALDAFPNNQRLSDSYSRIEQTRRQRLQAEQARLAAVSGTLAIDALPWAELTAIRRSDGSSVSLPDQRTTPLTLSLPEGQYTLTLDNADGNPQELIAQITRQQVVLLTADFKTLSANDYFRRANW